MLASLPDLLRLAVVPVFAWAAYRDVRTRRVPNWVWLPLVVVGTVALAVDVRSMVVASTPPVRQLFLTRVAVSLSVVAPLGYAFWRMGGFGGADAKAIMTIALLFPTYPTLYLPWAVFPLERTAIGVFSLTVLTNTVLVGLLVPIVLALRNAVAGRFTLSMFIGRPISIPEIPTAYGRLLETREGIDRRGLDIDALRMYLRWRGETLASVRSDPDTYRDPATLPSQLNDPGDGSLAQSGEHRLTDEGMVTAIPRQTGDVTAQPSPERFDDPWGAAAFLADIEGDAYGTTPEQLRDGLDVLCANETVWITPGMAFLVPTFVGVVIGLVYGDVLFVVLDAVGLM